MKIHQVIKSFNESNAALLGVDLITDIEALKRHTLRDRVRIKRERGEYYFPIFPHEWHDREDQIISHISSYQGIQRRVFARKCMVDMIPKDQLRNFCQLYHIQGNNSLCIHGWGIFGYDNELLGILSLGRHHRNNDLVLLDRLCFKSDVRVIGGASKLLAAAFDWAKLQGIPQIVSFSDNRWSTGDVYDAMGFSLDKELSIDYFYCDKDDYTKSYSKQSQKKSNTGCPSHISELKWAKSHGLIRVYDAGKKRWILPVCKKLPRVKHPLSNRRQGYHTSKKAGIIYWQSSYELKAALMLDEAPNVLTYNTQVQFEIEGRIRKIDFLATLRNGKVMIIEVKPMRRLDEFKDQIDDNKVYAEKNGWSFAIWTEDDLGFKSEYFAKKWADEYLSKVKDVDFANERKLNATERTKKHYRKNIATDTTTFWCDFCKKEHTQLRKTYENNIAKNGRHICIRENGAMQGRKPCKFKGNPYANEGKKKCANCNQILEYVKFGKDKSRADGYASRCKECRAKTAREKHQSK